MTNPLLTGRGIKNKKLVFTMENLMKNVPFKRKIGKNNE